MPRKYIENNSYDIDIHGDVDFDFFESDGDGTSKSNRDAQAGISKTKEGNFNKPDCKRTELSTCDTRLLEVEVHSPPDFELQSYTSVNSEKEKRNVPVSRSECRRKVNKSFMATIQAAAKEAEEVYEPVSSELSSAVKISSKRTLFQKGTDTGPTLTNDKETSKCRKYKELKNCIAFGEDKVPKQKSSQEERRKLMSVLALNESADGDQRGSDSESDMTNVTPISSSYESLVFGDSYNDKNSGDCQERTLQCKEKGDKSIKCPEDNNEGSSETKSGEDLPDMKLLIEAINELESNSHCSSSVVREVTPVEVRGRRKNMAVLNQEARRIDRENQILLKKILAQQKPRSPSVSNGPKPLVASAAINRRQRQMNIERENMILLKKIQSARSTVGSLPKTDSYTNYFRSSSQNRSQSSRSVRSSSSSK